jgi:hypothetical protein
VNHRLSIRIFLLALVSLAIFWTAPAAARLYPPCQDISYAWVDLVTIRYWVTDPISGQTKEETWSLTQGAAHSIESVQVDQGILTWIAKYRGWGEVNYTYEVHCRIYDLGRGVWKAKSWGPFSGYNAWLGQHQVKDGVVAWTAHRTTNQLEHQVLYVTYDPQFGSWSLGWNIWAVPLNSKCSPEVLRVKNGVLSWPMNSAVSGKASDENIIDLWFVIYDQELNEWNSYLKHVEKDGVGFDWIEILDDTVQVYAHFSGSWGAETWGYVSFNPYSHTWMEENWGVDNRATAQRRPFFVAAPNTGVVPFLVWFWDCSTALDGAVHPSTWGWWIPTPGVTLTDRSPGFTFTTPGIQTVYEYVSYTDTSYNYNATGLINAQVPAAPTGGISINNDASYTPSTNVSLSLNYGSSSTQMCFRASPGSIWWTPWEPVAASKNWTLDTFSVIGGTPDGPHSVSVQYRDQYGTESLVSTASITLDVTPPAVFLTLNNGEATTSTPSVRVQWSASDAIGLTKMSYATLNQGDSKYTWTHVDLGSVLTYQPRPTTFNFSSKPGRKTVMVRFTDVAGNVTHTQASIELKKVSLPFLQLLLD